MFECVLANGELFKKIVAALSDLVEQGNFMVDSNMISFQGMDSSHVSLVALQLKESGFSPYRCDRDICLGIQFASLNKILKCMTSKDILQIQAEDDGDVVSFIFEAPDEKRFSSFELKLNQIDQEQLGIPETQYQSTARLLSNEFQRICRDLSAIGDTVTISVAKTGIKFSVNGDIGSGDMTLKGNILPAKKSKKKQNNNNNDNDDDMSGSNDNNNNIKVKPEPNQDAVTQMDDDEDEDMVNNDGNNNSDNKDNNDNDDDDDIPSGNVDDDDDDSEVLIRLDESVTQTFSLRYLNNFTKATGLSKYVTLRMGADVPLECEYTIEEFGSLRYYLAPKIDDDDV